MRVQLLINGFTIKQLIVNFLTKNTKKRCKRCGEGLAEIRGKTPKDPRRIICPCCTMERLEALELNIEINESNNKSI